MHNQFSYRVKEVQNDGGSEFVNHEVTKFFQTYGIVYKLSCLGTLKQNGFVECHHRHIVKTDMTLMTHSSIPSKFWTTIFATSVFLIN